MIGLGLSLSLGSTRAAGGGWPPSITSSDGEAASLVDNGDDTVDVVVDGVTVGTISRAQVLAGGFITVVEPVVGMSGNNVVLTTTGYVIHVGSTPIETDVEVLANGVVVGTALPFDATAYPGQTLAVRFSYSVGGEPYEIAVIARAILWTPASLPTAAFAWYDFSDSATITLNGSNISQITNKGTGGPTVSQATAANQPVQSAAALNGLAIADFDGTNDILSGAVTWFSNRAMTFVAVYNPATIGTTATSGTTFIGNGGSGGAASRKYLFTGGIDFGNTALQNPALTAGQWNIAVADVAGTGSTTQRHWANGGTAVSGSVTNNAVNGGQPLAIGGNVFAGAAQPCDIQLAEVLIIPAALTTDDRQRVEGYLAHKWGLAGSLPSDHPYKSAAPVAAA